MQIVIPMSGFGERFRRAGYNLPKPLIELDGKPMIGHVIDMFPGEQDFTFICNEDHLTNPDYTMEKIIRNYCPTGKIVGISPHKLGPVHAVLKMSHALDFERPVVVNYCDFTCYWDWENFKKFVSDSNCDGSIPAYKGFHPHSLGNTNYAYLREQNGLVCDIQEKQPYTNNRMDEFASSGTYYFSSGRIMVDAFRSVMEKDLNVSGEYYVSLAYKILLGNDRLVTVYPLQHFMQWGTPEDVAEYNRWSATFSRLMARSRISTERKGTCIIPMAGLGQRFVDEGYSLTKPLIPVSGRPMVIQATHDLPAAKNYVFVIRKDMKGYAEVCAMISSLYPGAVIKAIDSVTEGQACTALIGLDALAENDSEAHGPITFGACDNGALYNSDALLKLSEAPEIDVIVWGIRGYCNATRSPAMFGWIDADEHGNINMVSVKNPLSNPKDDPVVLGTFTFREAEHFRLSLARLVERGGKVNGEFYIDSLINDAIALGLKCHLFEVDDYLCWGTPNDLLTYEYWQSCFHKWGGHPYKLDLDERIPVDQLEILKEGCKALAPLYPVVSKD